MDVIAIIFKLYILLTEYPNISLSILHSNENIFKGLIISPLKSLGQQIDEYN
jgi:hypothetical protein